MFPSTKQKLKDANGAPLFEGSFSEFYEAYYRMVRSLIYRIAGARALDDLVQEAFIKLWKSMNDFQYRCSLKTWVYRVTSSIAIDYCRQRARLKKKREFFAETIEPLSAVDPTNQIAMRELADLGLKSLKPEDRMKLVMIQLEGLTYREASEVLHMPEGTLKSELHRIRKELKIFYEKRGVTLGE